MLSITRKPGNVVGTLLLRYRNNPRLRMALVDRICGRIEIQKPFLRSAILLSLIEVAFEEDLGYSAARAVAASSIQEMVG
jgi:hypothetical protein